MVWKRPHALGVFSIKELHIFHIPPDCLLSVSSLILVVLLWRIRQTWCRHLEFWCNFGMSPARSSHLYWYSIQWHRLRFPPDAQVLTVTYHASLPGADLVSLACRRSCSSLPSSVPQFVARLSSGSISICTFSQRSSVRWASQEISTCWHPSVPVDCFHWLCCHFSMLPWAPRLFQPYRMEPAVSSWSHLTISNFFVYLYSKPA